MANIQKCAAGAEAASEELGAIVDKALGYPKPGVHVGGGKHATMPATWDGKGPTPPGWTKSVTPVWAKDAATSWLPIPDALATELQAAPAQAKLTAQERTTLANAIAARVLVDLEAQAAAQKPPTETPKDAATEGTK